MTPELRKKTWVNDLNEILKEEQKQNKNAVVVERYTHQT